MSVRARAHPTGTGSKEGSVWHVHLYPCVHNHYVSNQASFSYWTCRHPFHFVFSLSRQYGKEKRYFDEHQFSTTLAYIQYKYLEDVRDALGN